MKMSRIALVFLIGITLVTGLACPEDGEWDYIPDVELMYSHDTCECHEGVLVDYEYCILTLTGNVQNRMDRDAHNVVVTFNARYPEAIVGPCSYYIGTLAPDTDRDFIYYCTSTEWTCGASPRFTVTWD